MKDVHVQKLYLWRQALRESLTEAESGENKKEEALIEALIEQKHKDRVEWIREVFNGEGNPAEGEDWLVPFDELREDLKERDREKVKGIFNIVRGMGYKIIEDNIDIEKTRAAEKALEEV